METNWVSILVNITYQTAMGLGPTLTPNWECGPDVGPTLDQLVLLCGILTFVDCTRWRQNRTSRQPHIRCCCKFKSNSGVWCLKVFRVPSGGESMQIFASPRSSLLWLLYIYIYIYMHACMHAYIHTYMFVVVNFDALAQASDIRIERRQVVFLC